MADRKSKPNFRPWHPAEYEPKHEAALKALNAGEATSHQQKLALQWIINCARTYDLPYAPDSDRDTSFFCGMQHVGKQIVKLINAPRRRQTADGDPSEQP